MIKVVFSGIILSLFLGIVPSMALSDLPCSQIGLIDTSPMPALSKIDLNRGYVIFQRPNVDMVYTTSIPRKDEICNKLDIFATLGEYEPLTFAVHAMKPLNNLKVRISNLNGPNGSEISSNNLDLRIVKSLNKRIVYASNEIIDIPIYVSKFECIDIPQNSSLSFWITVKVPENAVPGRYSGKINITPSNARAATVDVFLNVLPYKLMEPQEICWAVYYGIGDYLPDSNKTITEDMKNMREHGMTSIGVYGSKLDWPLSRVRLNNEKVELNFDGTSRIEHIMKEYVRYRFPCPLLFMGTDIVKWAKMKSGQDVFGDKFAKYYISFVKAIEQYGSKNGWPKLIWQPMDEPTGKAVDEAAILVQLLKKAGATVELDGWGAIFAAAGKMADVWNINGGNLSATKVDELHRQHKKIWSYNHDVEGYRPELLRFAAGFMMWRSNGDGVLNWEYARQYSKTTAFNETDSPNFFMMFPAKEGEVGGPATSWEGFREGIDDYKYLYTLQEIIKKAKITNNPELKSLVAEAEKMLDFIKNSIPYIMRLRGTTEWKRCDKPANGQKTFEGPLKVPNGWDLGGYDRARWLIANETVKLMQAMKKNSVEKDIKKDFVNKPIELVHSYINGTVSNAPENRTGAIKRAFVPMIPDSKRPSLDGMLNEPMWKGACVLEGFLRNDKDNTKPAMPTTVKLAYDRNSLYFGIICMEEHINNLRATKKGDGVGNVWADDCVEIFLDTNHDKESFFHIVVNANGATEYICASLAGWKPSVKASGKIFPDRFQIEVAVPFKDLAVPVQEIGEGIWGFNIGRERYSASPELSTWSGLKGFFPQPLKFGEIGFGGNFIQEIAIGNCNVGKNTAFIKLQNDLSQKTSFVIDAIADSGDVKCKTSSESVELMPGERKEILTPFIVPSDANHVNLSIEVRETKQEKILAEKNLPVDVQSAISVNMGTPVFILGTTPIKCDLVIGDGNKSEDKNTLLFTLWKETLDIPAYDGSIENVDKTKKGLNLELRNLDVGNYRLDITLLNSKSETIGATSKEFIVVSGSTK